MALCSSCSGVGGGGGAAAAAAAAADILACRRLAAGVEAVVEGAGANFFRLFSRWRNNL
jgi:hypothetical protein